MTTLRNETEGALKQLLPEPEPGAFAVAFEFAPELEVFQGHFPDNPIVPGVMQIEAVRCAAQAALGKRLRTMRILRAKFTGVLRPAQPVLVQGSLTFRGERVIVRAELAAADRAIATVNLELQEWNPETNSGMQP